MRKGWVGFDHDMGALAGGAASKNLAALADAAAAIEKRLINPLWRYMFWDRVRNPTETQYDTQSRVLWWGIDLFALSVDLQRCSTCCLAVVRASAERVGRCAVLELKATSGTRKVLSTACASRACRHMSSSDRVPLTLTTVSNTTKVGIAGGCELQDLWRDNRALGRYHAAMQALLDGIKARPPAPHTIAGHLLRIVDPATGQLLSDERLLPEVSVLFMAGMETTGHTASWALFLVSEHPEVGAQPGVQKDVAASACMLCMPCQLHSSVTP